MVADPVLSSPTSILMGVLLAVLYVLPGLLAVTFLNAPTRASTWIALAIPLAVAIQIVVECLLKVLVRPLAAPERLLAQCFVVVALFVVAAFRKRLPALGKGGGGRVALFVVLVPLAFAAAFHESVVERQPSSDGVEAIEMARSLDTHFLPRWPTESGLKGLGQGLVALAFPNAWFGWPRFTFLLFLGAIVGQVVALAEARREKGIGWIEASAIALSVLAVGTTLGRHVSFDPYFADPASPAGAELMAVAMMLSAFVALVERQTAVFIVAAVLAHATLPSGLFFLVVLGAAWFAITRSRSSLVRFGTAIGICLVVTMLYEMIYVPNALAPGTTMEAGSETLASRVRLLIFTDFRRLAFLVIPCGIVPFFFLFWWKKHDAIASVATLVTGATFLFFFLLATYSPHYFAPAMVLAIVPFWRWARTPRGRWIGFAGAAAGLALSLPPLHQTTDPYLAVGKTILAPRDQGASDVLQSLAYLPWDAVDPERAFVATGGQLVYASIASDPKESRRPGDVDWIAVRDSDGPPEGYQPVISKNGWTLFARPGVKLEDVKERGYRTDFQAPWYRVPKEALFRGLTLKSGRYDLDLKKLFGRK